MLNLLDLATQQALACAGQRRAEGPAVQGSRSASARDSSSWSRPHTSAERVSLQRKQAVPVPGWVPQLPREAAEQCFYHVVSSPEHPEVAELVGQAMAKLGWIEDTEGIVLESRRARHRAEPATGGAAPRKCHLWNLLWTWTSRVRVPETELFAWQRVNHFQGCRCCS